MSATAAKLLLAALLTAVLSAMVRPVLAQGIAPGEDTVLPPPRSDEPAPPFVPRPRPPTAVPSVGPFAPPPPPPSSPFPLPDAQDPIYQPRDPGRNGWGLYDLPSLPQHFFVDKEVDILKPHLKGALVGTVTFPNGSQATVSPPTGPLVWTGAARIEVGWFLPPGLGYFALAYRGFADNGQHQLVTNLQGTPFVLRSRLDVNEVTFDYGTMPYSYAPRWYLSGRIGMGVADVFFDNKAVNAVQTQHASNNYYGAGPHARLDLWREFNLVPGLSLFAQPDLVVMVGQIHQRYNEENIDPSGASVLGTFTQRKTQTVPVFTLRTGVAYTPPKWSRWRFLAGYEFEEWWFVGQIDSSPQRGQFNTNGIFLRALVTY